MYTGFVRMNDKPSAKRKLREWIKKDDIDAAMQGIDQWNAAHPDKRDFIPTQWIEQVQAEETAKIKKQQRLKERAGGR